MDKQNYQSTIATNTTPKETFDRVNQIQNWWAKNFEGKSSELGDIFTVRFKSGDWYTIKISELAPNTKIAWDVIDAEQTWHEKHKEWVGTKIVFEISPETNGSKVTMTHIGLIPEFECYEKCKMGWDYLVKQSLHKYLTEGTGTPA